ncbi:uncharacterized protein MELLADRAFT_85306 [Melampsora larici-populina 98AG31]|uniref:Major facilitator superfamily (MFS) profile domain-containing protein n=1 Tax=Melampsora larici-populina (strain 98AG31 / pathotype 3-4-7) TaxID=747676 RepID=F4RIA9_MELLP|nr:uncharacterized protein MELLADRAFT_85306 [Melampsora larici-populina 98AG31]EGG07997.1 hypothetical protein MELLADRAFT_85306 [Melampsora larici-populina 98AG31]
MHSKLPTPLDFSTPNSPSTDSSPSDSPSKPILPLDQRIAYVEHELAGQSPISSAFDPPRKSKIGLLANIRKNRYVLNCALFASLGGILFGYDQGVISIILVIPPFTSRFPRIDPTLGSHTASFWKGFLTVAIEFGAILGVALAGFTADKYGRKHAIRIGVTFFILGSIIQTAAHDYAMLVIGRFLGGIGIGTLSMTAPMYMCEISPPDIRGALLCLEEFNIVAGIVIAFYITYGTRFIVTELSWRLPFGLQILPALVILFGLYQLPASPRWLANQGRYEESLIVISTLRQLPVDDCTVRKEWMDMRVEAEYQREIQKSRYQNLASKHAPSHMSGDNERYAESIEPAQVSSVWMDIRFEWMRWGDTFRHGCWRRTMVGAGLMFFQQFVGINALIYYSPTLFATLGLDFESRLTMSGIMNVCQLLGVSMSFLIMDKLGRRPLLLAGSVAMLACHAIVAILVGKYSGNWAEHQQAGWAGVTFIFIYMISFGLSWGPVPWAIPSEIFPSSLRAKGVAVSTMSNWINNLIIGLITPPLIERTNSGAFIFFAANSALSFVFVWFFVPETANRSLEDMDQIFGDSKGNVEEMKKRELYEQMMLNEQIRE